MKYSALTLMAIIVVVSGCMGSNGKDKNSKVTSPHQGTGTIETEGLQNHKFNLSSAEGDQFACGPTSEGYQVYVGPKEYTKTGNWGLLISFPLNAKFPGRFVFSNEKPLVKFSYSLGGNHDLGWYPNREAQDCDIDVASIGNAFYEFKFDCQLINFPIDSEGKSVARQTLRMKVDVKCNTINMKK